MPPLTPEQIEDIAVAAATRAAKATVCEAARVAAEQASLSREDLTKLVSETVRQTLLQLGVDASNPLDMQRDFQHLRQWRRAGEDLRSKTNLTLLGFFLAGVFALLLLGLKDYFGPR